MQSVSNLYNDKADRDLKKAQAQKIDAETQKVQAETRRIEAEAQAISIQNTAAILALGEKLTSGTQDALVLLSEKSAECARITQEADERQKKLAAVMENMGLQPPKVELPNNIIPFPVDPQE